MVYLIVFALLILLLVYMNKTAELSKRVERLAKELHAYRDQLHELQGTRTTQSFVAPPQPAVTSPPAASIQPAVTVPSRTEPMPASTPPPPKPSHTREEWEALIGGKLLNRIGAIALIIGVGFFLKYAFDNNWITETMRVVIGGIIGFGLLAWAERARKRKYEIFSQGLVGAGLSVLYLSVYASFNFYALVPQWVAFTLMGGVTVLSFAVALRNNSIAVALLGLTGGFLTPFMLSTGESNEIGLFTYIALLDAGILALVVMRERWIALQPLALLATYVVYLAWYVEFYTPDDLVVTVYCLSIFWVLFHAVDALRAFRPLESWMELREIFSIANIILFFPCLYVLLNPDHQESMAIATLVLGILYFLTALAGRSRGTPESVGFTRSVLTALVLLVFATAIQFTGFTTVAWWSAEAAVLAWCGTRWKMKSVWISASALFLVAAMKLFLTRNAFGPDPVLESGIVLNQRSLTFLLLAATAWISAYVVSREEGRIYRSFASFLYYLSCLLLFAVITVDTSAWFEARIINSPEADRIGLEFTRMMALAVVWSVLALALLFAGQRARLSPVLFSGLGILTCAVMMVVVKGIAFSPVVEFSFLLNGRFLAVGIVLAAMTAAARILQQPPQPGDWIRDVVRIIRAGFVLLLLLLLTGETRDIFQKEIALLPRTADAATERSRLSDLQQLSLSGVWLVYSIVLMVIGIWKRMRGLRIISIVLFGFTILKIFTYDLSFLDTLYRIFSFVGLGLILLVASYLYQRYKSIILGQSGSD